MNEIKILSKVNIEVVITSRLRLHLIANNRKGLGSDTMKRVAILLCDTPAENIKLSYGDYHKLFVDLLEKNDEYLFTAFDVVNAQAYPVEPSVYDVYILTGSKYSAYEDEDWINRLKTFIRLADKIDSIKMVGVCFGHQIIAEALGGKCEKNPLGWEVGWEQIYITDIGKELLFDHLDKVVDSLAIQEMHQDHVTVVPNGFYVVASTKKSFCQMMIKNGKYWCIQGHPECKLEYL